tara:strand:- start:230 stop:460 length:231 start_codon:yes stop_codon:yes gene_type:complete
MKNNVEKVIPRILGKQVQHWGRFASFSPANQSPKGWRYFGNKLQLRAAFSTRPPTGQQRRNAPRLPMLGDARHASE